MRALQLKRDSFFRCALKLARLLVIVLSVMDSLLIRLRTLHTPVVFCFHVTGACSNSCKRNKTEQVLLLLYYYASPLPFQPVQHMHRRQGDY
jgi:hypothetical protein